MNTPAQCGAIKPPKTDIYSEAPRMVNNTPTRALRALAGRLSHQTLDRLEAMLTENLTPEEAVELGVGSMSSPVLPPDHPRPLLGPLTTNRTQGTRMLTFLEATGVAAIIQTRMNSLTETEPNGDKRLAGQRPGPIAQTTVEMILLAWLLCAEEWQSYRRSELMRVLVGLHEDVASAVGLVDARGNWTVPPYKGFLRQLLRVERVLREGWTVVEHEGQPNEERSRYDMERVTRTLLEKSIPKRAREQVRHVALDSTGVRSWATFRPGCGKTDADKEPLAARRRKVEETDNDDIAEPDLAKHRRAAKKKRRDVPYGPDNRPIYTLDEDVRVGWKSANAESPKGSFLGFDLHLVAAALTVPVNCKIGSTNFQPMTQFVVGMKLAPGLSEYAATGAQAVLEARKVCPHITDATAASGSHAVPYVGPQHGNRTIVAQLEDLDQWQRLPYGTRAWHAAYHGGRGTIESVNSQLRDRKGLAHGTCRAFGLAANTMRALGVVLSHNLKKAAEWRAETAEFADTNPANSRRDLGGSSASWSDLPLSAPSGSTCPI